MIPMDSSKPHLSPFHQSLICGQQVLPEISSLNFNGLRSSRPKPESRCPKFEVMSPEMLSSVHYLASLFFSHLLKNP